MNRSGIIYAILGLILLGGLAYALFSPSGELAPEPETSRTRGRRIDAPKSVKSDHRITGPQAKPVLEVDEDMSPEDRQLSQAIQDAIDNDNLDEIRKLEIRAVASKSPEVRQNYVEAAGWFGVKSIDLLAKFLVDKNGDVRESAGSCWQSALSEVVDESTKAGLVQVALQNVDDEDLVEMMASEYYGMDEKIAIESIIQVVATGKKNSVAAAQEAYQFVTGDEWTSEAAARTWLKENYNPPENE